MKLGENIYRCRTQRGMSQGNLADALGVSRQSVSKWENDSATPDLDKLIKMAGIFEVTLDALVGNAPTQKLVEAESGSLPQREVPSPKAEQAQAPVAVEFSFPTWKVLGLVLIFLGALGLILGLALPYLTRVLVVVGLCGILFGIICLCLPYPQLFCGWAAWGGYLLCGFVLSPRWEEETLWILLAGVGLIAMLVWTAWALKNGRVRIPAWVLTIAGLLLTGLLILFLLNWCPPIFETVDTHPAVTSG